MYTRNGMAPVVTIIVGRVCNEIILEQGSGGWSTSWWAEARSKQSSCSFSQAPWAISLGKGLEGPGVPLCFKSVPPGLPPLLGNHRTPGRATEGAPAAGAVCSWLTDGHHAAPFLAVGLFPYLLKELIALKIPEHFQF